MKTTGNAREHAQEKALGEVAHRYAGMAEKAAELCAHGNELRLPRNGEAT